MIDQNEEMLDLVAKCEKKFSDAGLVSGSVVVNEYLSGSDLEWSAKNVYWCQERGFLSYGVYDTDRVPFREHLCREAIDALPRLFKGLEKDTDAYKTKMAGNKAALERFLGA